MEKAKEAIELIGKGLVFLVGVCYIVGLVIVNLHLNKYGFYSFSLLQINYILAGIWALVPVVAALLIGSAVFDKIAETSESTKQLPKKYRILNWLLLVLSPLYMLIGTIPLYLGGGQFEWAWIYVPTLGGLITFYLVAKIYSMVIVRRYDKELGTRRSNRYTFGEVRTIFITLIFFIAYMFVFARTLYREIPSSLGGGRPNLIQVTVKPEDKAYIESIGVGFSDIPYKTNPIELLLSTDRDYILLPDPKGNAVSVPHDLIKSVIYIRR